MISLLCGAAAAAPLSILPELKSIYFDCYSRIVHSDN